MSPSALGKLKNALESRAGGAGWGRDGGKDRKSGFGLHPAQHCLA